jgi:hypothetical protein
MLQRAPQVQPSVSQNAASTPGIAEATVSDSDRIRVTLCSIAWRCSVRLRSVMSTIAPMSPAISPSAPANVAL